jgi:hypothetical protein
MRREAHVRFLGGSPPRGGSLPGGRPGSYQSLRLKPLTIKGEVVHEADGTTVAHGSQPCANLSSKECPACDLPIGGKPTTKSVLRRIVRRSRGQKDKRVSESNLHGIVNSDPVALLTRGTLRARGWWDLPIGSSTVNKAPAGLPSRTRLGRMWNHRNWDISFVALPGIHHGRGADLPDCTRRANRCVASDKG